MKESWLEKLRGNGKFFFDLIVTDRVKTNVLQAIPFWIASLLTGLVAVGYTKLFGYSESLLQETLHWRTWSIFIITPVCFFSCLVGGTKICRQCQREWNTTGDGRH